MSVDRTERRGRVEGHERVWAAAGDPHSLFCVDPHKLASCVRARIVDLGE